jgi:hypothetical protein
LPAAVPQRRRRAHARAALGGLPQLAPRGLSERHAKQEVEIDLYFVGGPDRIEEAKVKLAPGMLIGGPLHPVALPAPDLLDQALDRRPLSSIVARSTLAM